MSSSAVPAISLLIVVVVLVVVSTVLSRRRKALEKELGIERPTRRGRRAPEAVIAPVIDVVDPRPVVADFHVDGSAARVHFDVPLPEGEDEVLSELLVGEAIEVVREKSHTLPLSGITEVVALAGRGETVEVGRTKLTTPGVLPPKVEGPSILNLSVLARDPLQSSFGAEEQLADFTPGTAVQDRRDELGPLAAEIRLPRAVETGLRAQGVDPASSSAGELVVGMLRLFGYQITPAGLTGWFASKGGERTYIVEDRYQPGDHPELDDQTIRRFMIEFTSAGADRGMLVSEKYGPFEIYSLERREPRVRFITRERVQKLIDSLALS
jgi:hypothetical protein